MKNNKENVDSNIIGSKQPPIAMSRLKDRAWKPSSLELCMQLNDPNPTFGSNFYEPLDSNKNNSGNIWDHSDSEAAPASSWSTLPNRSLLCRPLRVDIGRCTCIIVKDKSVDGLNGGSLYTLYTNKAKRAIDARKRASESMKAFFSNPENRHRRSISMKGVNFYCKNCGREGDKRHYCPELDQTSADHQF